MGQLKEVAKLTNGGRTHLPAPDPPGETLGDPIIPSLRRSCQGETDSTFGTILSVDSRHYRFRYFRSYLIPNFRRIMMRVM